MKARAIIPVLCQMHLSKQNIMIISVSHTLLTVSLYYRKKSNIGRHVLRFTPCYFAIIHNKKHIKMSPLAHHAFLWMLLNLLRERLDIALSEPTTLFWIKQDESIEYFSKSAREMFFCIRWKNLKMVCRCVLILRQDSIFGEPDDWMSIVSLTLIVHVTSDEPKVHVHYCRCVVHRQSPWTCHIYVFSPETAERNSTNLGRKQDINVLYQGCVFRGNLKNRMVAQASDWLRHFRRFIWHHRTEFNEPWRAARSQCPLPS